MSFNPWEDNDAEADDFKDESSESDKSVFTYVLIDCRESMFVQPPGQDETPFQIVMKGLLEVQKSFIVNDPTAQLGILFYGTNQTKNASDIKHVFSFQELDHPSATCIRDIEVAAEPGYDFEALHGAGPDDGISPLGDALLLTNMGFNLKKDKAKGSVQRIWVFTNDDNPNVKYDDQRQRAIQQAMDSAELGREINLFYIKNESGKAFDPSKYFSNLITVSDDDGETPRISGVEDFKGMAREVRKKQFKKRRLSTLTFTVQEGGNGQDGVELSVEMFATIMSTKKPSGKQLESKTNTPLVVQSKMLCSETGSYLTNEQIQTYSEFGGERVYITKDEMKECKTFCPKGIVLLGFKPLDVIAHHHNYRSSYFLYPTEEVIQGSTVAFAAIFKAMLKLKRAAVVRVTPRDYNQPFLAALVAQEHDEEAEVFNGMHLIPMPYQDDIRDFRIDPSLCPDKTKANGQQIQAAREVVKQINLAEFSSYEFNNPVIQKHYASVQALALEEDDMDFDDKEDDDVQPETMTQFDDILDAFKATYDDIENPSTGTTTKRKAPSSGGAAKKPKVDSSSLDWPALFKADQIKKQTVPTLKSFCKETGLSCAGKKADLVERVEEFLDS
jgi:ATP-dependent DNA helicase 2 subunit 1